MWAARIEDAGSRAEKAASAADEAQAQAEKRAASQKAMDVAAAAAYPSMRLPPEHPLSARYAGAAHMWPLLHAANFLGLDDLSLLLSVRPIALYVEELRQWRVTPTAAAAASSVNDALSLPRLRCSIPWFSLPSPLFLRLLGVMCTFTHAVPPLLAELTRIDLSSISPPQVSRAFSFDEGDAPLDPAQEFASFCTADVLFDQLLHSDTLWQRIRDGVGDAVDVTPASKLASASTTEPPMIDEASAVRTLLRHLYRSAQYHRTAHVDHLISSLRYDTAAVGTFPSRIADVDDAENQDGRSFDDHWALMLTLLDGARNLLRGVDEPEDARQSPSPVESSQTTQAASESSTATSGNLACPHPDASDPLAALLESVPLSLFHLFGCANVLDPLLGGLFRIGSPSSSSSLSFSHHRGCGLRSLNLHGCYLLRSSTLAAVLTATPNLEQLNLAFCPRALLLRDASDVAVNNDVASAQQSAATSDASVSGSESTASSSSTPPLRASHPFEVMAQLRALRVLDLTSCDLEDEHMERFCDALTRRVAADKALQGDATGSSSGTNNTSATAGAVANGAAGALSSPSSSKMNALSTSLSSVALSSAADLAATSASSRLASLPSSSSFPLKLSALNLANNARLSNVSLECFHRAGLKLADLCIYGDHRINDKGLLELAYARLQRFNYCGCYKVTDALKRFYISTNPQMLIYNKPQQFGAPSHPSSYTTVASAQEQATLAALEGSLPLLRCAHARH
jgi:hypothetical protein